MLSVKSAILRSVPTCVAQNKCFKNLKIAISCFQVGLFYEKLVFEKRGGLVWNSGVNYLDLSFLTFVSNLLLYQEAIIAMPHSIKLSQQESS